MAKKQSLSTRIRKLGYDTNCGHNLLAKTYIIEVYMKGDGYPLFHICRCKKAPPGFEQEWDVLATGENINFMDCPKMK